ncbi:RidA family protein [Actibacterium ureilyticum]|uniref:RidA family protein n=1 Tax=Actibacterium ureilyticum TaxID=1590614 RepID=UPI000BAAAEC3|nr:RidA family protein [Actibacterium ureilyticum]
MSSYVTRLNPATMPDSTQMGYSQISVVEPGRMAFVSGQVGLDPESGTVPEGVAAQVRVAGRNIRAALAALGATPNDIAIMRCYMTDLNDESLQQAMPPLIEVLDGAMPCITGIGVAALAAPEYRVEFEVTVRLPG